MKPEDFGRITPNESWGVLGPTDCPLCRRLRASTGFAVLLIVVGAVFLVGVE